MTYKENQEIMKGKAITDWASGRLPIPARSYTPAARGEFSQWLSLVLLYNH